MQTESAYQSVTALPLGELQSVFHEKIGKRWKYVHTNAMAVAFMLDPSMDLDDLVGSHDENVDDQVGKLAVKCRLVETADDPDWTREILSFKALKRRGGEAMRTKYSSSSPSEYWF
ncbi:unnamed protein product [Phytophthora fragariaefolia]|uniref:Unnamed protein product n=1 Tax=Phytophthora fragariaefolia TaxID=1490495 RepID=A0A9W6Y251_9STRA|nr:unnamed protein product [Phytophthora fragariaefolia]